MTTSNTFTFNTIEEALEDLRQGKIILVTDDPDRENEGDFICAAQFATTENVNFMAMHGKGLICMPMSIELCKKLQFPQMVTDNSDNHETAFTVSVDHISTTTGISAEERGMRQSRRQTGGFPPSGPYVSADGQTQRRIRAQRPHRSHRRPAAAGRFTAMRPVL